MGIVTNIFNKGSDRIRLSPDRHLAYCKRIRELGTMSYGDLSPSQQREVDNNLSSVKESTDKIIDSRFVRGGATTRIDALKKIEEYTSKFIDTFGGCEWEDDIRDPFLAALPDVGEAVPGFTLKDKVTKVSLAEYDKFVRDGNSRFGAIDLASAIKQRDRAVGREVFGAPKNEDKVTLAGKTYNSSVGSFPEVVKITSAAGANYYKSTFLFFHYGMGFLDSQCESSLIGPGGILIPGYKSDGTIDPLIATAAVPIKNQDDIDDRVSIAKHLLAETQAMLENSDLSSAAYGEAFELCLELEHNNQKHYAAKVWAAFTGVDTFSIKGNIERVIQQNLMDLDVKMRDLDRQKKWMHIRDKYK